MSLGGVGACSAGATSTPSARSTPPAPSSSRRPATAPATPVSSPANCPGVIAVAGLAPRRRQGRLFRPRPADHDQRAGRQLRQHRRGQAVPLSDPDDDQHGHDDAGRRRRRARSTPTASTRSLGTSFSAPLVAGTAALMLSVQPVADAGAGQGEAAVERAAVPDHAAARAGMPSRASRRRPASTSCECYCTTSTCGAGMLDAHAAVLPVERRAGEHLADDDDADRGPGGHARRRARSLDAGQSIATYEWTILNAGTHRRDDHQRHQRRLGRRRADGGGHVRDPADDDRQQRLRLERDAVGRGRRAGRRDAAGARRRRPRRRAAAVARSASAGCCSCSRRCSSLALVRRASARALSAARPLGAARTAEAEAAPGGVEPQRRQPRGQRGVGVGDAVAVRHLGRVPTVRSPRWSIHAPGGRLPASAASTAAASAAANGRRLVGTARRVDRRGRSRRRHRQQADRLRPHLVGEPLGLAIADARAGRGRRRAQPRREGEEEQVGDDQQPPAAPSARRARRLDAARGAIRRSRPRIGPSAVSMRRAPSLPTPAAMPSTSPCAPVAGDRAGRAARRARRSARRRRRSRRASNRAQRREQRRRDARERRRAASRAGIDLGERWRRPMPRRRRRCARMLMPMPMTATRPAPSGAVSTSMPASLRPDGPARPRRIDEPEVVRPLQADARRCAAPADRGHRRARRRPRARGRTDRRAPARPGEREGQRRAGRRVPAPAVAAAPGGLPVGDEQARREARRARGCGGAGARQQVVVGRAGLGDALDEPGRRALTSSSVPSSVFLARASCRGTRACRSGTRTPSSTFLVCRPSRIRP